MNQTLTEKKQNSLKKTLHKDFHEFIDSEKEKFPNNEIIKIDLHCHDFNSDVPDEILGRIMNLPETWIDTQQLFNNLNLNYVDAYTVTNHNNTDSCYQMQALGYDVLIGSEFSCHVPDFNVGIHVLAYGFNKKQESYLLKFRNNIYKFQEYACSENIPTIWAHPLYHYKTNASLSLDFFEKLSLIFERFEVINGQRDSWQNLLTKSWVENLSADIIDNYSKKYNIDPKKYCKNIYKKSMTGGSDSHIGLFAGETGTLLYVKNLKEKEKTHKKSELVLEALRNGDTAVYGSYNNTTRLIISLLDYVCQVALFHKDPGLFRMILHKGSVNDKILALIISNAFAELQQHRNTSKIIELIHNSLNGKKPKLFEKWLIPKDYKKVFKESANIAGLTKNTDAVPTDYKHILNNIYEHLNLLLYKRFSKKLTDLKQINPEKLDINKIISRFEIPSEFRSYINSSKPRKYTKRMSNVNITSFLDGLSFPFLSSSLLLAAHFTGTKVLYSNRSLLNDFSAKLNQYQHPKRILWLSDTYEEKNGVSIFLRSLLRKIQQNNLPIDILICSSKIESEPNLVVVEPVMEFENPLYKSQDINIPNFLEVQQLFEEREYDRIVCSTEGVMGLLSIYLKQAFNVQSSAFIHTDWLTYAKTALKISKPNFNRLRRFMRFYYKNFDNIFVLNNEQKEWFVGRMMDFSKDNVHITAHWTENYICKKSITKKEVLNIENDIPIIIFSGRLSEEKGVLEIVDIYNHIRKNNINAKILFAGSGPLEENLKNLIPDAIFLGWVEHKDIAKYYSIADLLILPSKFDTFSITVLEAITCELPVISYNTKGPKDIIENENCGILVNNKIEMQNKVVEFFNNKDLQKDLKNGAKSRAKDYEAQKIIEKLLSELKMN